MKQSLSLLVAIVFTGKLLFAQSVDQGKKFLYYDRKKSATETFDKLLAANPNNIDAVYWLGQTYLEMKDSIAAKNLYQKALTTNGSAPLLLVGMGQIELMEGKTNEARQRFETAINLTKGKDINVLNAVALANINARNGDAKYAIEKLTPATQWKNFNNTATYLLLGDAYRKLIDGGNAVTAYQKAFSFDPKLAEAKYSIGKIYLTQRNTDYFLRYMDEAIQADPTFAPAYYELFYYWYFRDVNKAAPYLDSYIANADQGPDMEYLKTDFTYAKGDFAGAKARAQQLITQYGDKVSPRMYRMVAYTCDTLGDMTCANQAMTTFFTKASPEDVLPEDYVELANINAKTPGSEAQAFVNFQKAFDMDTVMENKVKYLTKAAALAKKLGNRSEEANWLGKAYSLKPNPTNRDLYDYGFAHYQAANYDSSFRLFSLYREKYPDEIFGYLWAARSAQAKDTAFELGIAAPEYQKLAEAGMRIDSVKYKAQIIQAYGILASYENNVKKNKDAAIEYLQRIVNLDPGNADAQKNLEILKRPAARPRDPAPATKPKTNTAAKKKQ